MPTNELNMVGKRTLAAAKRKSAAAGRTTSTKRAVPATKQQQKAGFQINDKFAEKYEAKKKREELTELRQRQRERGIILREGEEENEVDESSSSDDDEEAELLTQNLDTQIDNTLKLIRARDPKIYNPEFKPYDIDAEDAEEAASDDESGTSDEEDEPVSKKKKHKPLTMQTMLREQVLSKIDDDDSIPEYVESDDSDDEAAAPAPRPSSPTYVEEQRALKMGFGSDDDDNDDDDDDDDDGDLFTVRKKSEADIAEENLKIEEALARAPMDKKSRENAGDKVIAEARQRSKNKSEDGQVDLNDPDEFLQNYIMKQQWLAKPTDGIASLAEEADVHDLDEEKADDYEAAYNFRFQEMGKHGTNIVGHPRTIEGLARRKDDRRKRKRDDAKQKKQALREQQAGELKRLKNLKRAELSKKLTAVNKACVTKEGAAFDEGYLDGEFDPEDWDKKMSTLFNEEFYDDVDAAKQDKNSLTGGDEELSKILGDDALISKIIEAGEGEREAEGGAEAEQESDELYKLDYEDTIAGGPGQPHIFCRFKYRNVTPDTMSLTKILDNDDKTLNKLLSIKRVTSTYREPGQGSKQLGRGGSKKDKKGFARTPYGTGKKGGS